MFRKYALQLGLLLCIPVAIFSCKSTKPVTQTKVEEKQVQPEVTKVDVDLILINGKVYTCDSFHPSAEAFAIKEGRFLAIGSTKEITDKYRAPELADAGGKAVFPGFFDAHCHFYSYGRMKSQADLVGTASFKEVVDRVVEYSKTNKSPWIVGRGWDQNDWAVKQFPTKDTLDKLFPNTPVYLSRVDGHAALVNSTALKLAGITPKTKIKGGTVEVKNGKLTGILVDNAADSVKSKIPEPSKLEQSQFLQKAERDCFKYGLTTVDEAGLDKETIDLIDLMQKKGLLKIKVYAMLTENEENKQYYYAHGFYKSDRLNVRSFKLYADGALGSRGAALRKPYTDRPKETGFLLHDTAYFRKNCEEMYAHGFQVNTHCIGDSANHFMLKLYGSVLKGQNDRRWRIEHAQVITPSDIPLFGRYDIIPSVQPTHATSDMYWAQDRLGKDRMKGAYAYKDLLEQNGLIALGSDFPVEDVNPLLGFYAAVARKDAKGWPEGGFQPENALSRQQALYGMTIWAAYSNFEEHEKGSITTGKFADFVILDEDIMTIPIERVLSTRVTATYVNGEKVTR